MIVVSDTSPFNYLLLLEAVEVLPQLYDAVIIPEAVQQEMLHPNTPDIVRAWAAQLPPWIIIRQPQSLLSLQLDMGERAAISLAVEISANLILIDERRGRDAAKANNLVTIGTLGILAQAARAGLVDLADALARLQQAGSYVSRELVETLLATQRSD